jgi:hypothetical protein
MHFVTYWTRLVENLGQVGAVTIIVWAILAVSLQALKKSTEGIAQTFHAIGAVPNQGGTTGRTSQALGRSGPMSLGVPSTVSYLKQRVVAKGLAPLPVSASQFIIIIIIITGGVDSKEIKGPESPPSSSPRMVFSTESGILQVFFVHQISRGAIDQARPALQDLRSTRFHR